MNLLIDIGNSNSKIAITKDYTILKEIHSSSKLIKKIKELFSNYKITHSSISNVSSTDNELIDFLKKYSCIFSVFSGGRAGGVGRGRGGVYSQEVAVNPMTQF